MGSEARVEERHHVPQAPATSFSRLSTCTQWSNRRCLSWRTFSSTLKACTCSCRGTSMGSTICYCIGRRAATRPLGVKTLRAPERHNTCQSAALHAHNSSLTLCRARPHLAFRARVPVLFWVSGRIHKLCTPGASTCPLSSCVSPCNMF